MLAIREMQIQTVRRCYLTQVRVAITPQQKQKPVSMWWNCILFVGIQTSTLSMENSMASAHKCKSTPNT